jgi:hypothetical protein
LATMASSGLVLRHCLTTWKFYNAVVELVLAVGSHR